MINKHIYFQDDEGNQDDKHLEEKIDDGESADIHDEKGVEEKINGVKSEDIQDDKKVSEKFNDVKSEETHDITLKREGDQLTDAPPCKKSLVTEM